MRARKFLSRGPRMVEKTISSLLPFLSLSQPKLVKQKEKAILRKQYFRSLFNYFILSLSISDLISAILSPCTLYRLGWGFDYWAAPAFLCKVKCASYSVFTDDVAVCLSNYRLTEYCGTTVDNHLVQMTPIFIIHNFLCFCMLYTT